MTVPKPPLSRRDVVRAIEGVAGRAVLVGGQAVAWWAEYYARQGRMQRLAEPTGMYVSKDVDFATASLEPSDLDQLVRDVANRMRGRSKRKFPFGSLVVASVEFEDAEKCERTIEFLRGLFGVRNRDRIFDEAVPFESETGLPTVYVMHPAMLLETRVANLVGLERYRTDVGLLQALVAADVLREWLREWLRDRLDDGWPEAREDVERTLRLAVAKRGITAAATHGIDILTAVPADHVALPATFLSRRLPQCREKVERAIAGARAC